MIRFGFSPLNAEIAQEWFRDGKLTNQEEEVINRIQLNLIDDLPDILVYRSGPLKGHIVANHLNYRITQSGGDARTPLGRKRL